MTFGCDRDTPSLGSTLVSQEFPDIESHKFTAAQNKMNQSHYSRVFHNAELYIV